VAVFSDGPLLLAPAFPETGDAPGVDAPGLGRPEEARRVLSAFVEGEAPLLVGYLIASNLSEAEVRLRAQWTAAGSRVERSTIVSTGEQALVVTTHGALTLVVLAQAGPSATRATYLPLH
jgi:hypothetical protein